MAKALSNRKPRHSLSAIDVKTMTATCAVCGPTDIRQKKVRQYTVYICATQKRKYAAEYRLLRFPPHPRKYNPSFHILSEIDDQNKTAICSRCGRVKIYVYHGKNRIFRRCSKASVQNVLQGQRRRQKATRRFINKYKVQQGCQNCGYNASSRRLELHTHNGDEFKMSRLAKFGRERLMRELQQCDVLCVDCHPLVHT